MVLIFGKFYRLAGCSVYVNNRQLFFAFSGILVCSFILHSILFVGFDSAKYNLYDTDTWYNLWEIRVLGGGGDISRDELLMYPEGRVVDWGCLLPYLLVPFADGDTPLQGFNRFVWFAPVAAALFVIAVYLLVSRIYEDTTGLYSGILLSVGTGAYFTNCLYGIIDHHILEAIFFTIAILSILLIIREKWLIWRVLLVLCMVLLYFTSTLWTLYFCIIFLVIGIAIINSLWEKHRYITSLFIVTASISAAYLFLTYLYGRFFSLLNWMEPIAEISYTSPVTLIVQYNILVIPIIIGISYSMTSRFKIEELILIVVSGIFFCLTIRFSRMGYILFPFVVILAAYYIDRGISKKYKMVLVAGFTILAILSGVVTVAYFAEIAAGNQGWGDSLEYLGQQPQGLVLSWWDYGHWIITISGQPPFTDPFQDRVIEAATIFTANRSQAPELLKKYDIHYIAVSEDDSRFYDAMVWYSKSTTSYENSYLQELISNESYAYKNGKVRVFTA